MCPVKMLELHISKLNPDDNHLWQCPKSGKHTQFDFLWYDKQVLGSDTIGKFMKVLTDNAKLNDVYTDHCIRKTCIQTLDDNGFKARHIIAL